MFAAIWGAFIQEKHLNLSKNSKFCGVLICFTPVPLPPLCRSLENKQPIITVKISGQAATKGNGKGSERLQRPTVRELSLFVLSGGSLQELTSAAVFIWLDLQLNLGNSLFPSGEYLSKAFTGNCSTLRLPEAADNSCTQWASQKPKRENWRRWSPLWFWQSSDLFVGI